MTTGQQPAETAEAFIDRKEMARRLGCAIRTVDAWMAEGVLPYYRIRGRLILFKWSEVEAHLWNTARVPAREDKQLSVEAKADLTQRH